VCLSRIALSEMMPDRAALLNAQVKIVRMDAPGLEARWARP